MAAAWLWVLLYVVGFVLLQVLLYRYLQRNETGFDGATPVDGDGEADRSAVRAAPTPDAAESDDRFRCPNCVTPNDRTFTYCRNCTTRLDGTA